MVEQVRYPRAEVFHHREHLLPIGTRLQKGPYVPTFEVDRIDVHYNNGVERILKDFSHVAPYFLLFARLTNIRIPRPGVQRRLEGKIYRARNISRELAPAPNVDFSTDHNVTERPLRDISKVKV